MQLNLRLSARLLMPLDCWIAKHHRRWIPACRSVCKNRCIHSPYSSWDRVWRGRIGNLRFFKIVFHTLSYFFTESNRKNSKYEWISTIESIWLVLVFFLFTASLSFLSCMLKYLFKLEYIFLWEYLPINDFECHPLIIIYFNVLITYMLVTDLTKIKR
jgi:hypothetical protein